MSEKERKKEENLSKYFIEMQDRHFINVLLEPLIVNTILKNRKIPIKPL